MTIPARLFFLLVSLLLTFTGFCQNTNYDLSHLYSVAELKNDFQYVRNKLETKHPNLYLYTPKEELNAFFDSLYQCIITPITATGFYDLITLLNSKIKDGHTMLLPGEKETTYANKNEPFFPFYIVISDGKLYVNMNCSADTSIKEGAELLGMNGLSAANIIDHLVKRQIRDGNNQTYPAWILTNYFKEYFSFSYGHPASFSITYRAGNEVPQASTIHAMSKDSIRFYRQSKYANRILLSKDQQGIVLETNKQAGIATLTIKSFDIQILKSVYKQEFKNTIEKLFSEIRDNNIRNLIVDIRDNQGGDFETGILLLSHLLLQPVEYLPNSKEYKKLIPLKNNYTGNLYVLVNGGSFSNSGIVSSYLELTKRAIFIGEETAGNKNIISGDPVSFTLPATKIMIEISTQKYPIRMTANDGHGIIPAYYKSPTVDDIIRSKDIVKQFASELISKQE
jgi:hypothetical protein